MILYRLSKQAYARDLSGAGASFYGGRWNSKGVPMLYTSESRALCVLEVAVHIPLGIVPVDYCMVALEISTKPLKIYSLRTLPEHWNAIPPEESSQKAGNRFVELGEHLLMKVPSAIIPGEFNYLMNPLHQGMKGVRVKSVEAFAFDKRLLA